MPGRSTLQRDSQADQRSSWAGPTPSATRRPPSAPRERKPALAAVAVLLIAGGALGAGLLVMQSGKRVAAVEVTGEIGAGEQIPASSLTQVEVASNTGLDYVPWSQVSQVTQFYAAVTLPPGTLLTPEMVVKASTVTAGAAQVGLSLHAGQMPAPLTIGSHVDVYDVVTGANCPGAGGEALAVNAVVLGVSSPTEGGENTEVTLALNPVDAGQVSCNASAGDVALAVLPAGVAKAGARIPPAAGSPSPGGSTSPNPSSSSGARK
jgi:hypothetical protein